MSHRTPEFDKAVSDKALEILARLEAQGDTLPTVTPTELYNELHCGRWSHGTWRNFNLRDVEDALDAAGFHSSYQSGKRLFALSPIPYVRVKDDRGRIVERRFSSVEAAKTYARSGRGFRRIATIEAVASDGSIAVYPAPERKAHKSKAI